MVKMRYKKGIPKVSVKDKRKPIYLGERIRGFIDLTRPFSLVSAVVAGFFLVLLCSAFYCTTFDIHLAMIAGFVLALLQSGGQVLNQSIHEEVLIDRLAKSYRPIPRGVITEKEGKVFAINLFIAGISVAVIVNPMFGFFAILITFFAVFYSAYPIRMKRIFLANNLWQGIARGALPILAVFSIYGNPFNSFTLALCITLAVWVSGAQTTKDFGDDIIADKKFGIHTLPVVFGKKKALYVMSAFIGGAFMLLFLFIVFEVLPADFLWLFVLMIPSVLIIYGLLKEYKLGLLENNLSWGMFYLSLGAFYVLPAVLMVF